MLDLRACREARVGNSLLLILFSIVCGVGGQITLKIGMSQVGRIGVEAMAQPAQLVFKVLGSPLVVGGLGLYVLGAMAWLTVLSRVPLSFAYPILALSYAITPIIAWVLLGEYVPAMRWLGIATICLGVFFVSRS